MSKCYEKKEVFFLTKNSVIYCLRQTWISLEENKLRVQAVSDRSVTRQQISVFRVLHKFEDNFNLIYIHGSFQNPKPAFDYLPDTTLFKQQHSSFVVQWHT